MPEYKSNAKSVLGDYIKRLKGIETGAVDKIVRKVAIDIATSNIRRIHNDGQAVDGSEIGDYEDGSYKKKRTKKGRRVDKVDLSFSGKLSKEFSIAAISDSDIGIGFITEYGAKLSEYLEEKYGKKIWGITEEDERVAREIEKNEITKYLKATGLI
jgi:hypothetical protein